MKILFFVAKKLKGIKNYWFRKTLALYYLLNKNYNITLSDNCDNIDKYDKIITFTSLFCKNLKFLNKCYKKIILIQTEHLIPTRVWYKVIIENKDLIYSIIEFSNNNIKYLNEKIDNVKIKKIYIGYSITNEIIFNNNFDRNNILDINYINNLIINNKYFNNKYNNIKKDIDVLMYGHKSKRRLKYYELFLKHNINCVIFSNFKNNNVMSEYLKRAKIVPVIYAFETYRQHKHIDFYRITHQISNKILTIHEEPFENEIDNKNFNNNLYFFKINNLIETCKKILNKTNEERYNISLKQYNWFKNNYSIDKSLNNINYLLS